MRLCDSRSSAPLFRSWPGAFCSPGAIFPYQATYRYFLLSSKISRKLDNELLQLFLFYRGRNIPCPINYSAVAFPSTSSSAKENTSAGISGEEIEIIANASENDYPAQERSTHEHRYQQTAALSSSLDTQSLVPSRSKALCLRRHIRKRPLHGH